MIGPGPIAPWLPFSWLGLAIVGGAMLGAASGGRALERFGIEPAYVWRLVPTALFGGLCGAKVWAAAETFLTPGERTFSQVMFHPGGLTFYGGFVAGTAAVLAQIRLGGKSVWAVTSALSPSLALAQGVGRIGCFLVGCDYGVPTALPWGLAFPHAPQPTLVPVHPTQLYESLWLFACACFLRRRLQRSRFLFAEYLLLQGGGRFLIETVRTNPAVLGRLTLSQLVACACVALGTCLLCAARRSHSPQRGGEAPC